MIEDDILILNELKHESFQLYSNLLAISNCIDIIKLDFIVSDLYDVYYKLKELTDKYNNENKL